MSCELCAVSYELLAFSCKFLVIGCSLFNIHFHLLVFIFYLTHMNFFELFNIPIQLKPDRAALAPTFFSLSRKYHPDFFVNGTEEEKQEALEKSAALNKAFRVLQNEDATIKYVLELKGLLAEEERYELPPAFLMEMMDINEQLMEAAGDTEAISQLLSAIDSLQSDIYEPVQPIVEGYQEGITSEKELLQVKEYYYKKKYLDRVRAQAVAKK